MESKTVEKQDAATERYKALCEIAEIINKARPTARTKPESIITYYAAMIGIKPPNNKTQYGQWFWLKTNWNKENRERLIESLDKGDPKNLNEIINSYKNGKSKIPAPKFTGEVKPKNKKLKQIVTEKILKRNLDVGVGVIYALVNTKNGKQYIGSTRNLESRWSDHRKALNAGKHSSKRLQAEWEKHKQNIEVKVLHRYDLIGRFGLLEIESHEIAKALEVNGRNKIYNTELDPFKREISGSQTYIK